MNLSNFATRLLFFISFFNFVSFLLAQTPTGILLGEVIDQDNRQGLIAATLLLKKDTSVIQGGASNEKGEFTFTDIPTGRYLLEVSYVGYTGKNIIVVIESGKNSFQSIELKEGATTLSMLELSAGRAGITPLSSLGSYVLTVEETRRFPANFDDPARLTHALPGVANNNDQNNALVVRGNTPNGLSWRLEGTEVVSPNHLSNAGTFSDRASRNAGGVNILSGQLLGTSNFISGPFLNPFANATSGVLDMHLRNGNEKKHEFTAQASLLGFDVAAEGPFTKQRNDAATFLINYRYSFTGLLADMGVDFGGEEIRFQDLAFHLNFPLGKNNHLSYFGLGGSSSNDFSAERDTAAWTEFKEQQDIRYENNMVAVGLTYTHTFPNAVWRSSFTASALRTERRASLLDNDLTISGEEQDLIEQEKYVFHSVFSKKINAQVRFDIGLQIKRGEDLMYSSPQGFSIHENVIDGDAGHWLFQPYADLSWQPGVHWELKAGIRYTHERPLDHKALEPSAEVSYQASSKHRWSFAYSHTSQQPLPDLLFLKQGRDSLNNRELGFHKSHHLSLGHHWSFNHNYAHLATTVFYQHHYDVPVDIRANSTFSAINLLESFQNQYRSLLNSGTGDNYGIEVSYDQFLFKDYFMLLNGSVYQATYTDQNGIERDSRFNGKFILNLTAGREWAWVKKGRAKTVGMNGRFTLRGGYREMPIDMMASRTAGYTIFDDSNGFSLQQDAYYRLDVRFYLKNDHKHFTSLFAIDIQNVLNRENPAYQFYDPLLDKIVADKQLGLIPNLSYRIVF